MQDCIKKVETKAVMTVKTKFAILLIVSRFIKLNFKSYTLLYIGGYPQTPVLFAEQALPSSINPNPFFVRMGFNLPPAPSLSREGSNRSSCRSDTKVSWDHQRSRLVFDGWRTERPFNRKTIQQKDRSIKILIIYTIVKTPRGLGARATRIRENTNNICLFR